MKFAYADPPYPGMAHRYPEQTEVDHAALIQRLCDEYPDGWALSTSSVALRDVLVLCPQDVRILAWTKTWVSFKPSVNPAYAWEPVLVRGGRRHAREQITIRDWLATPADQRGGFFGSKPTAFCWWILNVLNYQPGDTMDDLFPGTGAMAAALRQLRLLA